ncbi:MAG TPA: 2-hydroxychromene-2-carboxylate isomerase [Burkholderiales bacterium]|nr:2-hydroxychromene-2-carboxylate isomerase [Burkholderiales bacterium]
MKPADWYFDFISPFAYIAFTRLERLSDGLQLRYHPVLFAGLLNHWEQKGPAEIPGKRIWTYRWCTWWAAQQGIAFRLPAVHPFNPLPYLRLAIAAGNTPQVIQRIFEALWTTGTDPGDPHQFAALARSLEVDASLLADQAIKDSLKRETEQAIACGVFGVPTFIVDGELFWGADAMEFLEAYLANPELLASNEMKRVGTLPVGAARKNP